MPATDYNKKYHPSGSGGFTLSISFHYTFNSICRIVQFISTNNLRYDMLAMRIKLRKLKEMEKHSWKWVNGKYMHKL